MKQTLKKIAGPKVVGLYRLRRQSALENWGWFESIKNGFPCDKDGKPIPWISYPAIALITSRMDPNWDVFEFGAGYSTIWWANKCHSVTSCEHDAKWCSKIGQILPGNCTLIQRPLGPLYPLAAAQSGRTYDIVIVDGRKRVKCATNSLQCLNSNGVIIWDDSDRSYYSEGLLHLKNMGFKQLDLIGMSPQVTEQKQTSILYRDQNVMGL